MNEFHFKRMAGWEVNTQLSFPFLQDKKHFITVQNVSARRGSPVTELSMINMSCQLVSMEFRCKSSIEKRRINNSQAYSSSMGLKRRMWTEYFIDRSDEISAKHGSLCGKFTRWLKSTIKFLIGNWSKQIYVYFFC